MKYICIRYSLRCSLRVMLILQSFMSGHPLLTIRREGKKLGRYKHHARKRCRSVVSIQRLASSRSSPCLQIQSSVRQGIRSSLFIIIHVVGYQVRAVKNDEGVYIIHVYAQRTSQLFSSLLLLFLLFLVLTPLLLHLFIFFHLYSFPPPVTLLSLVLFHFHSLSSSIAPDSHSHFYICFSFSFLFSFL